MRLAIPHLWYHCMAHRQECHELVCDLSLPRHILVRRCCLKWVLGHLEHTLKHPLQIVKRPPTLPDTLPVPLCVRLSTLVHLLSIYHPADTRTFKLHLVAGECARLVRKYKLDLAKLFDEGRRAAERGRVGAGVVHVEIRVDEGCLLVFDDFHGDDEGDGDEIIVENNKREYVCRSQVSARRSSRNNTKPSANVLAGRLVSTR